MLENGKVFYDDKRKVFRKGYLLQDDGSLQFDNTLDLSSFYGVMMYAAQDMGIEPMKQTLHTIEAELLDKSPSGGTPRYEYDHYFEWDTAYKGNPWFVTTLWVAQYYVRTKQLDKAKQYVDWMLKHALPSGMLSEQLNPVDGTPIGVTPLVWTHAELVNTVLDLTRIK